MTTEHTPPPDLQRLLRWEESGGTWRVAARRKTRSGGAGNAGGDTDGDEVTLSLLTCDGGEEMDVFSSADPELLAYVQSGESAAR
ncbi:hypothetical protein [Microbacterium sp. A93]|uniref:hypothetical protein n=1 Tax=Microbacterium sp. A93 TaxID=3450716 RepID=UPI003F4273FA